MKKTSKLLSFFTFAGILFYIFKQVKFWLKKTGGNEGWITETKASWSWRYWSNLFFLTFLTLYNRLEIRNKEAVTKKVRSHCVVVANHESILDGFILAAVILKSIYFMVKKEAFERPIAGYYLRKVACFPVDRSKNDASAIKTAFKLLDEGETFADFMNKTLLYPVLGYNCPVYVSQSPLQLSGDFTQKEFIKEIKDVPIVLMPVDRENYRCSSSLDGVANAYRYYRVSEYIFRNYRPLCRYGNDYAVWCIPEKYDSPSST